MSREGLTLAAAGALAVIVPAGALYAATPAAERAEGLVAVPFGWPQVLFAHLLAALPVSYLVAGWVARGVAPWREAGVGGALAAAGVAATVAWGPEIGEAAGGAAASSLDRLLLRVLWCVLLQVPWWVVGRALGGGPPRPWLGLPGWAAGLLAVVVGVVLPAVSTRSLASEVDRQAAELTARGQWRRAQRLLAGLPDAAQGAAVARRVAELERAVRPPLPAGAPASAVALRAQLLAALDRLDDARRLAAPLAPRHPDAALLLAALDYEQGRREDSDAGYRAVLARTGGMRPSDRVSLWRVQAYEGLADNARRDKDLAGAVAVFQEALAALPEAEAYFHVQLGRQLLEARRPAEARRHLQAAVDREPQHYEAVVRPLLREVRQGTPGCFLRR